MTEPELLVSHVLKGKYFSKESFLHAPTNRYKSWV